MTPAFDFETLEFTLVAVVSFFPCLPRSETVTAHHKTDQETESGSMKSVGKVLFQDFVKRLRSRTWRYLYSFRRS